MSQKSEKDIQNKNKDQEENLESSQQAIEIVSSSSQAVSSSHVSSSSQVVSFSPLVVSSSSQVISSSQESTYAVASNFDTSQSTLQSQSTQTNENRFESSFIQQSQEDSSCANSDYSKYFERKDPGPSETYIMVCKLLETDSDLYLSDE